ncbi:D-2-hydroxyacid dehydrogenase family protein [Streptomyces sp. NPDC090080]|uniref:D-2-hydroxyacid dehydrogenase family protein n=1 Tax=Streptomyces sp. NPDC090080 TaxID=3365939 RepID=UPI00380C8F19
MKIAIIDDYQNVALDLADWQTLQADVTVYDTPLGDEVQAATRLAPYDVIVAMRERTPFPASLLRSLPKLRLLVTTGPRNAAIDLAAATQCGVTVSGTGYEAHPTTELTWALILAAARLLPRQFESMRAGGWQVGLGNSLRGATLGVLGLGNLGSAVCDIGRAFGMETIAWSQNLTPEYAEQKGVTYVERDELFSRSDVLSVHVVLSDRTRGIVGARELSLMKPTAIFVNTSRGAVVDEAALLDTLEQKSIAAAALDVFDQEPLPADHPLRLMENAVLTPHIGYVSRDLYEIFYQDAVDDIRAWAAGSPLRVLS